MAPPSIPIERRAATAHTLGSAPAGDVNEHAYLPTAGPGVRALLAADPSFDVARFLDGAQAAYRLAVPHYPLEGGVDEGPIHQAFTIGRVRFIVTDARSERDPSDVEHPSMLGEAQLAWFEGQLREAAAYAAVVWVNASPWIDDPSVGQDTWGGFAGEREHIGKLIEDLEQVQTGVEAKVKKRYNDKALGASYELLGHMSDDFDYILTSLLNAHYEAFANGRDG